MDKVTQNILQQRAHGLYLTRTCSDITQLSRELLGLHCWFHRNVVFSAVIRGAGISNWKTALTKTWLYRGTLHGAAYDDLPQLLALHTEKTYQPWFGISEEETQSLIEKVVNLMEDGVYSRAEMRKIFAYEYDDETISRVFSPWGGVFVSLAREGKVAFRSMVSRDFDLIDAQPSKTYEQVLPELLYRFFAAYGPATVADAQWFFGLSKQQGANISDEMLEEFSRLEHEGKVYYSVPHAETPAPMPRVKLLAGFDPYIVSYAQRSAVLPDEYKKAVILKSGICLPTVAVNGQVAGLWNIKKGEPTLEFFTPQPAAVKSQTLDLLEEMRWKTNGQI